MKRSKVLVQESDFDVAEEIRWLRHGLPEIGAVATFIGTVRDINENSKVSAMTLEHYPGMTERALAAIVDEARERWPLLNVCVIHRVGELAAGDPIVFVGVASAHRDAAFDACRFIMDFLKTRAPFWKRESTPAGERWVDERAGDQIAAGRWQLEKKS